MTQPIRVFAALAVLAVPACFDPMVDPVGTGPGSETDGSTTDPSASSTLDTDSAEGPLDSTGSLDAPPEITAFTINGSTMPAEQQIAGLIELDVDATDDIGIDHVEIYDGDELVTTIASSPYQAEILISSADNGSHLYSAVVFDTAGQSTESEVVPLSVNVVGGEILELREDIGEVQITFGLGAPRITTLPDGNVIMTGMARLASMPDVRTGLLARGYNPSLSLLWSSEHAPPAVGLAINHLGFSAPSASTSLPIVYVGGQVVLSNGDREATVFFIDSRSGALTESHTTWTAQDSLFVPVSATPSGDVLATMSIAEVARYDEQLSVEHWASAPMGDLVFELIATQDNEAVALFIGDTCASGSTICLRKLSPAGDTQWTRAVAESTEPGIPTQPTISSDGHIAVAVPTADGNATLLVFDGQGNTLTTAVIDAGLELYSHGMTYTPSGDLVLVGRLLDDDDVPVGWATRVQEDGTAVWEQIYSIGTADSVVSGVAISSTGRLYVSGYAESFDLEFLTQGAHAWLAELTL